MATATATAPSELGVKEALTEVAVARMSYLRGGTASMLTPLDQAETKLRDAFTDYLRNRLDLESSLKAMNPNESRAPPTPDQSNLVGRLYADLWRATAELTPKFKAWVTELRMAGKISLDSTGERDVIVSATSNLHTSADIIARQIARKSYLSPL